MVVSVRESAVKGRFTRAVRPVVAALVVTLLAACTAGTEQVQVSTVTSTVTSTVHTSAPAPDEAPAAPTGVTVPELGGAPDTAQPTTAGTVTGTEVTPTTETTPAAEPANIRFSLEPDAEDVDPRGTIKVKVDHGTLTDVTLTNPAGKVVEGATLNEERTAWIMEPELGFGRTYRLVAEAENAEGQQVSREISFTTLVASQLTSVSAYPLDGATVGVGQPIAIYFDRSVTDRQAVEDLINIDADPKTSGTFYWIDDRELRWRPKVYWKAGTTVSVKINVYGRDLGDGRYGAADKKFSFTVGRSKIAVVDDNDKIMRIKIDGKLVKEMPVSLGSDQYPTYNGVHVVAEKYDTKIMDSSTWGLTGAGAYRTEVKWASRISSSGEFVHAAPWSVWAQGAQNVSHGCINVSEEDAKWFYDNFGPGDVVDVRNTKGDRLKIWDGFGDWTLTWEQYKAGS